MKLRLLFAAVAVVSLSGCGLIGGPAPAPAPTAAAPTSAVPSPTAAAPSPTGSAPAVSVKDAGDLPDPCTLLSDAEVEQLTGRGITRTDADGAASGTDARFCQWQQPSGQLAVFLARTTPADYELKIAGADPVDDLGDRAFVLAGHLYVLYGTVQIDVYVRGDDDQENLTKAVSIAEALMPRI